MESKIIKMLLVILGIIVIYLIIYNYTAQINRKNKHNTFETITEYENYRTDYVNSYVKTLQNDNFSEGFEMLTDESKKVFNEDIKKYTEQIKNLTKIINRQERGIKIEFVDVYDMKKYNQIEYKIISKRYEYTENNEVYYSDEFSIFKEFNLIEYSPNVFKIDIKLY